VAEERKTPNGAGREEPLREMRFLDHLEELRSALFASVLAWIGASIVFWFFSKQVLDFLIRNAPVDNLYFMSPVEAFMIRMKLSFILGFLASFPYIFLRVWRFVSPGLFSREQRVVLPVVLSSVGLFYGGLAFAYFTMIPIVIAFFIKFGTDRLLPLLSIERYFGFVWRLCFAFGVVFQMPIVILALTWVGILSAKALLMQWRFVIVIIFVIAAVFTPPDPMSQLFMAVPLCVLYLASMALAFVVERRRKGGKQPES
jgi:sec-independent protein translocase protein TatC